MFSIRISRLNRQETGTKYPSNSTWFRHSIPNALRFWILAVLDRANVKEALGRKA